MGQNSRKVSNCAPINGLSANASLLAFDTANSVANNYLVSLAGLLANTPSDHKVSNGFNFVLRGSITTPADSGANATVEQGTIAWDSNYLYVATANGTFKRVALSTF